MNDGQRKTFGPVFQQKFMNEALRLQTAIEDVSSIILTEFCIISLR